MLLQKKFDNFITVSKLPTLGRKVIFKSSRSKVFDKGLLALNLINSLMIKL